VWNLNDRIEQLDSVRGLASFSVFLHHMYMIVPVFPLIFWYSPLRVLVNGHGAVILFFVLSGFVLTLPYLTKSNPRYVPYIIKRFFRIYLPYLIAIAFAFLVSSYFYGNNTVRLSEWFNVFWKGDFKSQYIVEHILILGNIHSNAFNTVVWSLVHEMRVSIIFPLIAFLVIRFSWKFDLLICLILSVIGGSNEILHFQDSNGYYTTYFDTFHYCSVFIIGSLLAKYRFVLVNFYRKLNTKQKYMLLIVAVLFYVYSGAIDSLIHIPYIKIIGEYGLSIGASIFLIVSLGSGKALTILSKKPIVFLGKVSYSLYLYHFVVLMSFVNIFYNMLPMWLIFSLAAIVGISIAFISYKFVELPSIKLGKSIVGKMKKNLRDDRNIA
jgi:peptidoglycan/LPS O-acetylase OafA/YrhL